MRICYISSEVAPLAKTGGLADVAGALPADLQRRGHDIRLFMPYYPQVTGPLELRPIAAATDVAVQCGPHELRFNLLQTKLPGTLLDIYLIDCPALYDRPALYTLDPDEHLRFLLLQRAALECCQRLQFAPQIIHCNDWHAALVPLLLKTVYGWDRLFAGTRTLLTIHNIGYQGIFPASTANTLNLGASLSLLDAADLANGQINWLKNGIVHADRVSTVSPTYAREICTPAGGYGLDAALRARSHPVAGILNGVDYSQWNPATDAFLDYHFSEQDLSGKRRVKAKVLRTSDDATLDLPLIGVVSRMTVQKGFDLLFDTLPGILAQRQLHFFALGSGDAPYENFFASLQQAFPDRVTFIRGYNERLGHMIEAGSDLFLMPSLYEPCGLNQLYSLKYGTVPIVRRTGGLADSVQMWDPATRRGTGVVFNDFDANGVRWAIETALDLFQDKSAWRTLIANGMAQDFSWEHQGGEYEQLYKELLAQEPA